MDDETSALMIEYNEQLKQVNEALSLTDDGDARDNLLSLKNDLQQLIALTHSTHEDNNQTEDETKINDEYAVFMAEMEMEGAYKGATTAQDTHQPHTSDVPSINMNLHSHKSSLEGTKCRAPHCHTWGAIIHHNALIATVLHPEEENEELHVKVLFINPTHKEMLPCPYYLESECRFSEEKCRFSHGEIVPYCEVKQYVEPDFASLEIGSAVLAKQDDKLWHKGMVQRILRDKEMCIVKLERSKEDVQVHFVDVLPAIHTDDAESDDSAGSSGSEGVMDESAREDFINMSLMITPGDDKLGGWEKYTKGIGSKLMEKMGYIIGTGLGRRGEGRIQPVTAVALPPGKSLDHCMHLRQQAGDDKNLFNVERRLKRQARKQDARNQKHYERERKKVDVFTFLNDTLASHSNADGGEKPTQLSKTQHRKAIKAETSRNLNVESFKIERRVKELQAEMIQLQQAMQRQAGLQAAQQKQFADKYHAKEEELKYLENKAWNIKNEQSVRNTTRKLTKF